MWNESVAIALLEPYPIVNKAAFLAGADMPMLRRRPLDRITPEIAVFISGYAYETSTREEQKRYSALVARSASPGDVVKPKILREA